MPIFTFDPRFFANKATRYGTLKCGPHRLNFTIEAVNNLRHNLRKIGSDLLVSDLPAEKFLQKVAAKDSATVLYQQETCSEEQAVEAAVKSLGFKMQPIWNSTLLNAEDLP